MSYCYGARYSDKFSSIATSAPHSLSVSNRGTSSPTCLSPGSTINSAARRLRMNQTKIRTLHHNGLPMSACASRPQAKCSTITRAQGVNILCGDGTRTGRERNLDPCPRRRFGQVGHADVSTGRFQGLSDGRLDGISGRGVRPEATRLSHSEESCYAPILRTDSSWG